MLMSIVQDSKCEVTFSHQLACQMQNWYGPTVARTLPSTDLTTPNPLGPGNPGNGVVHTVTSTAETELSEAEEKVKKLQKQLERAQKDINDEKVKSEALLKQAQKDIEGEKIKYEVQKESTKADVEKAKGALRTEIEKENKQQVADLREAYDKNAKAQEEGLKDEHRRALKEEAARAQEKAFREIGFE